MSWAKTPRILLVWPKGEDIALRPIDLKILDRHARSLGAALGLVTRDRRVRREAAALGLPVFESPRTAQRDEWPSSRRPKLPRRRKPAPPDLRTMHNETYPPEARWRGHLLTRVAFFTLGVLAILAVAASFVPHARITFTTESKRQTVTMPVVADPSLTGVFISGSIPAREITLTIEGSQDIPSTGKAAVPESEAKGVARFRNLTAAAVPVPLGTVVQTIGSPSIRFVTTEAAEVPAGVGKTADVPIQAVGAGGRGNLDTDVVQAVEGPLGLTLAVTNPAPTSGGTDRTIPAPSAEDRERVRVVLLEYLRMQVQRDMLDELPEGSVVFPVTVKEVTVLDETYDPPAGKTGDSLTLKMRVEFSARYASGDDLRELAVISLAASLENGYAAIADPLTFETMDIPSTAEDGKTTFQIHAERSTIRVVDERQAFFLVQGRNMDTARDSLHTAFPFVRTIDIELTPAWWPWLPLVPFQVEVVVE